MNCEEAEELLGAYALGALPEEEALRVAGHLRSCPEQAALAAELRGAASRIAATVEPVEPPPRLRGRILDAVAHAPQGAAPAPDVARALRDAGAVGRARTVVRFRRTVSPAWAAIAAVLVAAVIGLGAWNIALQRRSDHNVGQLATRATSISTLKMNGSVDAGVVVYYADEKQALIVANGVPVLDGATQTYQLWAITDGHARSIGLMAPPADGNAVMVVAFDASKEQQLAVSVEPAGGSPQPTTTPVFTADV